MKGFLLLCLKLDDKKHGGVQMRISNYVQNLPKFGYTPVVISFGDYSNSSFSSYKNAPLYLVPKRSVLQIIKTVILLLTKHKIKYVHIIEGTTGIAQIISLLVARLFMRRTAVSVYSGEYTDLITHRPRSLKLFLLYLTLFLSRRVAANSKATASLLPKFYQSKIRIVYPGVSLRLLQEKANPDPYKKKYRILFVGRHFRRKGIDDILQSLVLLKKKLTSLECFFIGDDVKTFGFRIINDRKRLGLPYDDIKADKIYFLTQAYRRLSQDLGVDDVAHFIGNQKLLAPYYAHANVVALPSKSVSPLEGVEGFGNVILEAGLFKKPAIGTNHFGIMEAIINNKTGLLIPENDPKALSEALYKILTDNTKAKSMGEEGYKRVMRDFTAESSTKQLISVFS